MRQPARATLGILGVAAWAALLLDMLLLSQGLVTSMQDLLDSTGFDIRVAATDPIPGEPDIADGPTAAAQIAELPAVSAAIAVRTEDADIHLGTAKPTRAAFVGVSSGRARPWTVLRGADITSDHEIVINQSAADAIGVAPGATVSLKAHTAPAAPKRRRPSRFA